MTVPNTQSSSASPLRHTVLVAGVQYTAVLHPDGDLWLYSDQYQAQEIVARGRWTGTGIECGAVLGDSSLASLVIYADLEKGLRGLVGAGRPEGDPPPHA